MSPTLLLRCQFWIVANAVLASCELVVVEKCHAESARGTYFLKACAFDLFSEQSPFKFGHL
jgi:hypothetical protein